MSCLCQLCLFAHSGVQHILCYVFTLFCVTSLSRFSFCIAPSVFFNIS